MKFIKKIGVRVLLILGILLLIWMSIDLNTRISTLHFLEDQEMTLQADVIHLQSTLEEVEYKIDYAKSDTAVEEWARQQGLMKKEGDHVIIPLPGYYAEPTETPVPEVETTPVPNWKVWEKLIFN